MTIFSEGPIFPILTLWHQVVRGVPPYIAEYEADCPKEPSQVTKDSSKVEFLASVLLEKFNTKAAKTRDPKLMTRDAAEDVIYKKVVDGRKKAPADYSMKQVFGAEFLETKPVGIRHGVLDPENASWEDLPECEIHENNMPDQSDLLIDSSHDAVIAALPPMSGTRHLRKDQRYPSNVEKIEKFARYQNEFGPHRFVNLLAWYTLKEIKGKKILLVSDSTLNPLASYP